MVVVVLCLKRFESCMLRLRAYTEMAIARLTAQEAVADAAEGQVDVALLNARLAYEVQREATMCAQLAEMVATKGDFKPSSGTQNIVLNYILHLLANL